MTDLPICPCCGQPIVPPVPDLTPIKQRILNAVKRRPGISAEKLRAIVWDDPSGGPKSGTRFLFTSRN